MDNLEESVRKHVLKNAYDYGKANPGSVIGKVIAEYPNAKRDMKTTMALINKVIAEVSLLSKEEIEEQMKHYSYVEKKEKEKEITLPGAQHGAVVTRFAPEPNGYPHIGHAKAVWLSYEGARAYDGRMVLRFDDTNPEKESQEYVDAIREDLKWLGVKWDKESYTSDNIPKIYEAAEKLLKFGKAYVCTCDVEKLRELRTKGKACNCRGLEMSEHIERWKKMLNGDYAEGKAILRYMGDINSLNTAMRDPTLARIIEAKHYRQGDKYRVWPSYDMSIVVMDFLEGITHPMRSKEYELRDELYYSLFDDLGWKRPTMVEFSRLSIKNAPVSKRLLKPLVEEKKVSGWDDPRLPTIAGLRRRGILPTAVKNFVLSFGISKVESEPSLELLLAENRKLLDPMAKHYFFVKDPILLRVKNLRKRVKIRLHPKEDLGLRELEVEEDVLISGDDAKGLKEGEVFRLKDLCNVKLLKKHKNKLDGELMEDKIVPKKIQWVPDKHKIRCKVIIPHELLNEKEEYNPKSLEIAEGYCENGCADLKLEEVIQFERFGFCRLDKIKEKELEFIFSC